MALTTARAHLLAAGGQTFHLNPLWKAIGNSFSSYLIAKYGDSAWLERFYILPRANWAVEPKDVDAHVSNPSSKLYVIQGPAGIGKTSFLRYSLCSRPAKEPRRLIWVDVLQDLSAVAKSEIPAAILAGISASLERLIDECGAPLEDWWRHLLKEMPDIAGRARLLRNELNRSGNLRPRSVDRLDSLLEQLQRNPMDLLRIQLSFAREVLDVRCVVVIDNVDQESAECLSAITQTAAALAGGFGSQSPSVFLALRPLSLRPAQVAFGTVKIGRVAPPDLGKLLRKRLSAFLELTTVRLPRNPEESLVSAIKEIETDLPGIGKQGALLELFERFLTVATDNSEFLTAAQQVQLLTNWNTRVSLLAVANYAASGHLPIRSLLTAMLRGETGRVPLHIARRAMYLGARAHYSSEHSWLINMFNDEGGDFEAALVRPRLLRLIRARDRLESSSRGAIISAFVDIFGTSPTRVDRSFSYFEKTGLIHEPTPNEYALTDSGNAYLVLLRDFEYLQHIALDTPVETDFLVKVSQPERFWTEEPASIRTERVLRMGEYVRESESRSLQALRSPKRHRDLFDDATVTNAIAFALREGLRLQSSEGRDAQKAWARITHGVESFSKRTAVDDLRRERNLFR